MKGPGKPGPFALNGPDRAVTVSGSFPGVNRDAVPGRVRILGVVRSGLRAGGCGVAVALAVVLAACGGDEAPVETPEACLGLASEWREALESAGKEPVRLQGSTPISGCLPEGQSEGERWRVVWTASVVGSSIAGGQRMGTRDELTRDLPGEAFQAGYLAGAFQAAGGTDPDEETATLVERINQVAARGLENRPPRDRRAFEAGVAAGRATG